MDDTSILVEERPGYRVITLNRPQRLNAFTEPMHQALRDALAEAESDEDCRARRTAHARATHDDDLTILLRFDLPDAGG